jgi:hypothetical protein
MNDVRMNSSRTILRFQATAAEKIAVADEKSGITVSMQQKPTTTRCGSQSGGAFIPA